MNHASMRCESEAALAPLLGLPLFDMMRYVGCQKFEFGPQRPYTNRHGKMITWGDWGLVVACDWKLTGSENKNVVSSDDFGPKRERRDDAAKPFYDLLKVEPPIVERIVVSSDGGFAIDLTRGFTLQVIPNGRRSDDRWQEYEQYRRGLLAEGEQWRLMPMAEGQTEQPHFVVTETRAAWGQRSADDDQSP